MDAIDTCTWNAGADRYTGTIAEAIYRLPVPPATQAQLVAAWEARRFDDHVYIDRDSIRGQTAQYAPEVRHMAFGSRGRVCRQVDRSDWHPRTVQAALVVSAHGVDVAIPAVCSNVFLLTRLPPASPPPGVALVPPLEALPPSGGPFGPPIAGVPPAAGESPPMSLVPPLGMPPWSFAAPPSLPGVPGVLGMPPGSMVPPAGIDALNSPFVAAPIPEPGTYALLLAGLAVTAQRSRMAQRRRAGPELNPHAS